MKQETNAIIIMNQFAPSPYDDLSYGMTGTIEPYNNKGLHFIFQPHGSDEQYVIWRKDFKFC